MLRNVHTDVMIFLRRHIFVYQEQYTNKLIGTSLKTAPRNSNSDYFIAPK